MCARWLVGFRSGMVVALVVACGLTATGCRQGASSAAPSAPQVAAGFVNAVVLPQLGQLAQRCDALAAALDRLASQPSPEQLAAARRAWVAARQSWESGESRAFGPASTQGFDANLDDWPVNEKDLGVALQGAALTPALYARLTTTARGFHGIESVLFGSGATGAAAAAATGAAAEPLSPVQLSYLRQAGGELAANARGLQRAWQGPTGFGARFGPEEGDDAGRGAVAEILQGMVGTLQEVAAEKLGKPLASRDATALESFYSGNTQADVVANLDGIQDSLSRSGLLAFLAARDPGRARAIETDLAAALRQARALPPRLNEQLGDPATRSALEQLMASSRALAQQLEQAAQSLS